MEPAFNGWATKANIKCSDGRVIADTAFAHQDETEVPLVWEHQSSDPENVLGVAKLKHRKGEGMHAECYFLETPKAQAARALVENKIAKQMSIAATGLTETGNIVHKGTITEVSLVLRGANPGAKIENVYIRHSDGEVYLDDEEAIITTGEEIHLRHSDSGTPAAKTEGGTDVADKTPQEVWDSMNTDQQNLAAAMALVAAGDDGDVTNADGSVTHSDGTTTLTDGTIRHADGKLFNADGTPVVTPPQADNLKHTEGQTVNVFDQSGGGSTMQHGGHQQLQLTHSQREEIFRDAKRLGSLKESLLQHAEGLGLNVIKHAEGEYGIGNIELLFPDAKAIDNAPQFVKRRTEWVAGVLAGTTHLPFAKVKSRFADITHDEARAKGYVKGTLKKEEFFELTQRSTGPATVYKKQKLDRDDLLDITDFDVVGWLEAEMRLMLEEEVARCILIGDGREVDDEDKVKEPSSAGDGSGIRSILNDDDFYSHKVTVAANISGNDLVEKILMELENYRGSGNPTFYTSRALVTKMLLSKDRMGRRLYQTKAELASALDVADIVTPDVFVQEPDLLGIIVNLRDYAIGTNRGGQLSNFNDFDLDYNQYRYLIETRLSGALIKWKSALVIKRASGTAIVTDNLVPTFNDTTGVVTIPSVTGVKYYNSETDEELTAGAQSPIEEGATIYIEAVAQEGYYFPALTDTDWEFTRPLED